MPRLMLAVPLFADARAAGPAAAKEKELPSRWR